MSEANAEKGRWSLAIVPTFVVAGVIALAAAPVRFVQQSYASGATCGPEHTCGKGACCTSGTCTTCGCGLTTASTTSPA